MTLVEVTLARIQEALRQVHAEARTHAESLGRPPHELVVEQKAPSAHQHFNTGRSMRRWRVTADAISAVALDEPVPDPRQVGMYYDHGRGDFSILEHAGIVRVGWQVGPTYGRGFDFPIRTSEDGSPTLGPGVGTWVS